MSVSETYRQQAISMTFPDKQFSGTVGWKSPSNIALVKYWGKRTPQLPMNPSLSFTLHNAFTEITVRYQYNKSRSEVDLDYEFEGKQNNAFTGRIREYLNCASYYIPFINKLKLDISSSNSFPHSAGIASSASAFSALALCILDIEISVSGVTFSREDFLRKASFLARLGSGSASRSIYGGCVIWGNTPDVKDSSDEYAIRLSEDIHPEFKNIQDVVLVLDDQVKGVSSSNGHRLMKHNPYSAVRFAQAKDNVMKLYRILTAGDVDEFITVIEYEALSLHAMMLTSFPSFFLLQPNTLAVMMRIREFRNQTRIPVGFTLDAGPNIHLLYPAKYEDAVNNLIQNELIRFCKGGLFIRDFVGEGPVRINHG